MRYETDEAVNHGGRKAPFIGGILYAGYLRFEDYCKERWGWGRNYANKQIAAAEIVNNLGTAVPTERHARELAPLARQDPDRAGEVIERLREEKRGACSNSDCA